MVFFDLTDFYYDFKMKFINKEFENHRKIEPNIDRFNSSQNDF